MAVNRGHLPLLLFVCLPLQSIGFCQRRGWKSIPRADLSENREPGEDMQMRFEKPGKRNGRINGSSPFLVESAMFLYAFVQGMEKKGGEGMPLGNGGRKSGVTAPRQ